MDIIAALLIKSTGPASIPIGLVADLICRPVVEGGLPNTLIPSGNFYLSIKVSQAFETAVSIFNKFTDFSLYNLLFDKEHYIGI